MPPERRKPWKKPPPKSAGHTKLSSSEKEAAKRSAKHAGRSYPNLVDNMKVAARKKKTAKNKATKKAARSKRGR